jgi:hypothetical protein
MTQPGSIHTYRWKLWRYLPQLLPILANVLFLSFIVYAFIFLAGVMIRARSLAAVLLIPALLFLMVVGILRLPVLIIHVGSLVASYLVVSPDALEIRFSPLYHVHLRWEDVEFVSEPSRRGGAGEMLSLEKAKELPDGPTATRLRKLLRFVRTGPRSLPLRNVQGYPRGGFADDLRRYAPHLFAAE